MSENTFHLDEGDFGQGFVASDVEAGRKKLAAIGTRVAELVTLVKLERLSADKHHARAAQLDARGDRAAAEAHRSGALRAEKASQESAARAVRLLGQALRVAFIADDPILSGHVLGMTADETMAVAAVMEMAK